MIHIFKIIPNQSAILILKVLFQSSLFYVQPNAEIPAKIWI